MNEPTAIKRGTKLELDIQSLAYGGMGVAKADNFVIFVKNAIPGQRVFVRVYKKRKGYAEASVKEVLRESKHAERVRCNHYYICSNNVCVLPHRTFPLKIPVGLNSKTITKIENDTANL